MHILPMLYPIPDYHIISVPSGFPGPREGRVLKALHRLRQCGALRRGAHRGDFELFAEPEEFGTGPHGVPATHG